MFRFANPYYLYLLLIIPIMVVIYLLYIYGHKKRMETLGEYPLIEKLTNDLSYKRKHIKFTLLLVCLIFPKILIFTPGLTNFSISIILFFFPNFDFSQKFLTIHSYFLTSHLKFNLFSPQLSPQPYSQSQ